MRAKVAQNILLTIAVMFLNIACDDEKSSDKRGSSTKSIATNDLESVLSSALKDSGISLGDVEPIVKAFVEAAISEQTRLQLVSTESNASEIGLNSLSVGYRAAAEFAINTGSMSVPGYASIAAGLSEGALAYWLVETGKAGIPDIKILLREMIRTVINIKAARSDISENVLASAVGKMNSAVRMASFVRNDIDDASLIIDATTVVATELGSSLESGQINSNIYNSSIKSTANSGAVSITSGIDLETLVKTLLVTVSDSAQNSKQDSTLMADVAAIAARAFTNADDSVRSKLRETLRGVLDNLKSSGELSSQDFDLGMARFDSEVTKPLDDDSESGTGSGSGTSAGSGSGTSTGNVIHLPSSIEVVPLYATTASSMSDSYWNKFVDGSITSLDCDPTTSISCFHAGEFRKAVLEGVTSCDGLTATDSQSAFGWKCAVENDKAVFKSTGLMLKKGLKDLVTAGGWKNMSLTVQSGSQSVSSTPAAWWTNNVEAFPTETADSVVFSAYKVYVITANINWPSSSSFTFSGNGIAIVTLPNVTFTSSSVLHTSPRSFTWLELKYEHAGAHSIANFNGGYNTIRASEFNNTTNDFSTFSFNGTGNRFIDSTISHSSIPTGNCTAVGYPTLSFSGSHNLVDNARIVKVCSAIKFSSGKRNRMINSKITQSNHGLYLASTDSLIHNNEISGGSTLLQNWAPGNVITGNFLFGGQNQGLHDASSSGGEATDSSAFIGQNTILNSQHGIIVARSSSKMLQNFIAANTSMGIYLTPSIQNYLIQDTLSLPDSNTTFGAYLDYSLQAGETYPSGTIVNSRIGRCSLNYSSTSCKSTETSALISDSVMGRVTSGDSANAHNASLQSGSGVLAKSSIQDWFNFSYPYRIFANYGAEYTLFSLEIRKMCDGTNCALNDYRIKSNASILLDIFSCPDATSTLTHKFFQVDTNAADNFEITHLVRAQELISDGIGDDDGLCENNETCLRIKNYGAYQGHGNLVNSSCPALTGAFNGVTLLEYATNGY